MYTVILLSVYKSEEKAADVVLFAGDGAMLKRGRNVAHVRTVNVQKWAYEWVLGF